MPGLIDAHAHGHRDIHAKGFFEDLATKHMWMTPLLEYTFLVRGDAESSLAALQASVCSLLRSGCTTVAELFGYRRRPFDDWVTALAATGIRAYLCPMVQSGRWYTTTGRDHLYEWFEDEGVEDLAGRSRYHRCGGGASVGPAHGHGRCGAGGHLYRAAVRAGQRGRRQPRHPHADPRGSVGDGVPRDDSASRQDADRMAAGHRGSRPDHAARACHPRRPASPGQPSREKGHRTGSPPPAPPSSTAPGLSRNGARCCAASAAIAPLGSTSPWAPTAIPTT